MKQAKSLIRSDFLLCAGILSAAVIGCGREEIKVYTAPKDTSTPLFFASSDAKAAAEPSTKRTPSPITWKVPAGWKELAPTGMRVGNFLVENGDQKAEIGIVPLPGSVGGELENVNRWRGEIGLEPVKEGGFTSEQVTIGNETGKLYELPGSKLSTIAAWLEKDGANWFFKLRGDKEIVAQNKTPFVDFLKTIAFAASENKAAAPQNDDEEEERAGDDHGPKWEIPTHWKSGPEKPMVVKNWEVAGEKNTTANIAVSSFPGDVGGVVANVNRWRGQLGLSPQTENEIRNEMKVIETSDGHSQALYVDITGKDRAGKPSRMIPVIVPHGSDTWFYKLQGDDAVVEREKAAFLKLVQTANYH